MTKRWRFFMMLQHDLREAPDSWELMSFVRDDIVALSGYIQRMSIKGTRNTIEVWSGNRQLGYVDVSILPDEEYTIEITDIDGLATLHMSVRGIRSRSDGFIEKPSWWNGEMLDGWFTEEAASTPFDFTTTEFVTSLPHKGAV